MRIGKDKGEIRPDVDVERATSMVIEVLYADHLAGLTMSPEWEESVVDDILVGLKAQ